MITVLKHIQRPDPEAELLFCIREVEEETGKIVRPIEQFLTLNEYLTEAEERRGVVPEWLPLKDAIEMFSKHESLADVSEEQRGSYLREYTALCAYMDYLAEKGK